MQGNRVEFYRQTIAKLISGLEPGDDAGRQAIYERMRVTNEGYIEKNRDRLSDAQAHSMRAQLDDAIDETERSFSSVRHEAREEDLLDLDGMSVRPDAPEEPYVRDEPENREEPEFPDGMRDPLIMAETGGRDGADPAASPPEAPLPPPVASRPRLPSSTPFWREGRFLTGLIAGLVAGGLVAFGVLAYGPGAGPALSAEAAQRQAVLEEGFQATRETAEREIRLVRQIENLLVERQRNDGAALAEIASRRFQVAEELFPEIEQELASIDDRDLTIRIRATENDYKIRFNSPICATVRLIEPELVDAGPSDVGIGCRFFGAWSDGGASF